MRLPHSRKTRMKSQYAKIPGPTALPIVGNLFDLDLSSFMDSNKKLCEKYGGIWEMTLGGERNIMINDAIYLEELCDETRFKKYIKQEFVELRRGVKDGLFTAHEGEPGWGIAHRILMPAFSPLKVKEMLPSMKDIADQLILKWARLGGDATLHATEDFTRLTLDTIAYSAMDYRFNSFYRGDEQHPFVKAMCEFLTEAGLRSFLPSFVNTLRTGAAKRLDENIRIMQDIARNIVKFRREHPVDKDDLLNAMLFGKDPKTGKSMDDDLIIRNMITFLIAGHETTSGLLSFVFYYLLTHKDAYYKAQTEVDEVVGDEDISTEHLSKLSYIDAVLRETLRLMPTAPAFFLAARKPEILAGKYQIPPDVPITVMLGESQASKTIFGEDAHEWKPERMSDENFSKCPAHAFKAFGNGSRACIGRNFAWQEAKLLIAMLLQHFDLSLDDPQYKLKIKDTLTIKPDNFNIRARLRHGKKAEDLFRQPSMHSRSPKVPSSSRSEIEEVGGSPMTVLYGTNSGTCEALARRLALDAGKLGFAPTITVLDKAVEKLPDDRPVLIVTTSYDGNPTDNATAFVEWLEKTNSPRFRGLKYAVFGCGHSDWKNTFHRVPRLIDEHLSRFGAERLTTIGLTNVANSDIFLDLEAWEEQNLIPALREAFPYVESTQSDVGIVVTAQPPMRANLRKDLIEAEVTATSALSRDGVPRKRYLELKLPAGAKYSAGDHLLVLPVNPSAVVDRVLRQFHLSNDTLLTVTSPSGSSNIPTSTPILASELFGSYLELCQPATPRAIQTLLKYASDVSIRAPLESLAGKLHATEIQNKHVSILELLERFPSISLPLSAFISLLPPLRVRTYSVASAPDHSPGHVSMIYTVVNGTPVPGSSRDFEGVASTYLSRLSVGSILYIALRPSKANFNVPTDPSVPIVMIASGSGVAPFRGFIQERYQRLANNPDIASKTTLFLGTHSADKDDLCREEFAILQEKIKELNPFAEFNVFRSYSRDQNHPDSRGCKYVQHRVRLDGQEIIDTWVLGGTIYVCGGKDMSVAVHKTVSDILFAADSGLTAKEKALRNVLTDPEEWFDRISGARYVEEVF